LKWSSAATAAVVKAQEVQIMSSDPNYQNDLSKLLTTPGYKPQPEPGQEPQIPLANLRAEDSTPEMTEGFGIPADQRQDISNETAMTEAPLQK
jgi:hypothetical protein